jgi:CheY-like chemotaxis protein
MQILFVEDDAILAVTAAEALSVFGHTVIGPAHSVDEALQLAASHSVDMAFVDINLAGKDEGIRLAEDLMVQHGIFSLFVSGQVGAARTSRQTALGLLPKPYLLEDLDHSARFLAALVAGKTPPPPKKPAALELF